MYYVAALYKGEKEKRNTRRQTSCLMSQSATLSSPLSADFNENHISLRLSLSVFAIDTIVYSIHSLHSMQVLTPQPIDTAFVILLATVTTDTDVMPGKIDFPKTSLNTQEKSVFKNQTIVSSH